MQKYCLVHISDIHVKGNEDDLCELFEKAAGATILTGIAEVKKVMVLFTGDLAFSGRAEEYQHLQKGLDRLKEVFKNKGIDCEFLAVPGNHDCDFKHPRSAVRDMMVQDSAQSLSTKEPDRSVIHTFLGIQEHFFNFCIKNGIIISNDSLTTIAHFDKLKLRVNYINTAWASELNESDDRPFILSELKKLSAQPGCLNISLFHHPKSWIDKTILGHFVKHIEEASDFIFTGHEHSSSTYEMHYTTGESQVYYEAGAFRDSNGTSSFRTLLIDTEKQLFTVNDFTWSEKEKLFHSKQYEGLSFPKNPQTNALGLLIDSKFARILREPGVTLRHGLRRDLELQDFYVFPRLLIDSGVTGNSGLGNIISTQSDFLNTVWERKISIAVGSDRCGKTSLCKTVFEGAFSNGALPILIHGEEIKSVSSVVIKNLISDKIKTQYKNGPSVDIFQDPKIKSLLIIDRFDQIQLAPREIGEVMKMFAEIFTSIFVTADSSIEIQILGDPRFGVSIDEISRIQISPLSNHQRMELINNWMSIGNAIALDSNNAKSHQLELYINTVIYEFGVPNFPLFVLTYLEVADAAGGGLNLNISSNAKLLETLVDLGLSSVKNSSIPQMTLIAYLRELGYHCHCLHKATLSSDEITSFHKSYCDRLDVVLSQKDVWQSLCAAKILFLDEQGHGSFKYPYFRSFFIATHLNFHSTSP